MSKRIRDYDELCAKRKNFWSRSHELEEVDRGGQHRIMECRICGRQWTDIFEHDGYTKINSTKAVNDPCPGMAPAKRLK